MNERQKKKYSRKWVNASIMFIAANYPMYHSIKNYYKLQKIMNKNVNRGKRLWQNI